MKTAKNNMKAMIMALASLAILLFMASCSSVTDLSQDTKHGGNKLPGSWQGKQTMTVRYSGGAGGYVFVKSSDSLPTQINIANDGSVIGKIGGASFANAHVEKNRGAFGRTFNLATDYVIKGNLEGFMFAGDSIAQKTISIPLWQENGYLCGDVFSNKGLGIYPMGSIKLR